MFTVECPPLCWVELRPDYIPPGAAPSSCKLDEALLFEVGEDFFDHLRAYGGALCGDVGEGEWAGLIKDGFADDVGFSGRLGGFHAPLELLVAPANNG